MYNLSTSQLTIFTHCLLHKVKSNSFKCITTIESTFLLNEKTYFNIDDSLNTENKDATLFGSNTYALMIIIIKKLQKALNKLA